MYDANRRKLMKITLVIILILFILFTSSACSKTIENNALQIELNGTSKINISQITESVLKNDNSAETESSKNESEDDNMININIIVGDSVFLAKLYDNESTRAFLAQLPISVNMYDLNGNEKYYYLADDLPFESTEKPAVINTGDIMCWSDNCLVLFYKSFNNSYGGYVRLGYIDDVSGLSSALGSGNIEVTFAVNN